MTPLVDSLLGVQSFSAIFAPLFGPASRAPLPFRFRRDARPWPRLRRLLLWIVVVSPGLVGLAPGQVNPGTPSFSAYDSHTFDTINLQNLNILLSVSMYGKSGAFPFQFSLNSNSYCKGTTTWMCDYSGAVVGAEGGFINYFNPSGVYNTTNTSLLCPDGIHNTTKISGFVVIEPNGTTHPLPPADLVDTYGCYNKTLFDTATDSSGFSVSIPDSTNGFAFPIYIYLPSGMGYTTQWSDTAYSTITPTSRTDTNGNTISINPATRHFTDTLGDDNLDIDSAGLIYSWKDVSASSTDDQNTTITKTSTNVATNFGCTGITDTSANGISLATSVTLPIGSLSWTFEATYNKSGYYTGRLGGLTLPAGGSITYSYSGGNHGIDCTYQVPPQLTRVTSDGTTTYTWAAVNNGGGNWGNTTTVVDNGSNETVYTFTGLTPTGNAAYPVVQALTQVQRYQGSSTLLTTDVYCYNGVSGQPSNCPTAVVSLPVTEVDVYHTISGMSTSSRTQTKYDNYGNVTYSAQYDFGASSPTLATTTTYGTWNGTQCVAVSTTINNKACDVITKSGSNTITESRYAYDSKGNLLTTYVWTGSVWLNNTTPNGYNSNGTIATSYDLANNPTTYAYSSSSYTSCGSCTNYPFPTSITKGALTTSSTWNGTGAVKLTDTEANGKVTTYGYTACVGGTADPFWRVMSTTDPLGNTVCNTYPTSSSADTANSSFTFNSGNSIRNRTVTSDGYGRVTNVQTQQGPSASSYDTVSTSYGWSTNYRTVAKSQSCSVPLNGNCAAVHTSYFDTLGRLYQKKTTSNETLTHTYTQNDDLAVLGPAPSGENTKQVQKEYDGLGRLTKSCAIGNGSSTACGQNTGSANGVTTSFAYSYAPGSTTTTAARGVQSRSKTYDALGRVTSVTTPEGGTTQYVYDTASSTCYNIVSNGDLVEKIDNAQVHTCYGYDALHRLTGYGAVGSTSTFCPNFVYGDQAYTPPSGVTINNGKGRIVEAYTSATCNSVRTTDEWFSYDADGRITDIWEMTPNSGTYYHSVATFFDNGVVKTLHIAIPNKYTQTYSIDGEGRLTSLSSNAGGTTTVVSSASYNAASQPTNVAIGSGTDYDGYVYDGNTGRMKNWTFQVGTTPRTETATLQWNPNGTLQQLAITDGFNSGGTQTCNYNPTNATGTGYDDLGRLVGVDCGSGGWGQTFSYDQYDNLTKAVISGRTGTAFNPGYNSPNNHFASGFGASYDLNGDLTYDTFHTYEWNEFGKMKSVDRSGTNCATSGECIVYDAYHRAVEIDSGSTSTEIMFTQLGKTAYLNGTTLNYAYWPTPGGGTLLQPSSAFYYEHKDWLGSARLSSTVTNETIIDDRAFSPYGELYATFGSTAQNENIFTGDTQDIVAGMYETPNRELSIVGRWISPDPAGAGWNQYAYATNPNSNFDPSGLFISKQPFNGSGSGAPNPASYYDPMMLQEFNQGLLFGTVGADAGTSARSSASTQTNAPPTISGNDALAYEMQWAGSLTQALAPMGALSPGAQVPDTIVQLGYVVPTPGDPNSSYYGPYYGADRDGWEGYASVKYQVFDTQGNPVANAVLSEGLVQLDGNVTAATERTFGTDANGITFDRVGLTDPSNGDYNIEAQWLYVIQDNMVFYLRPTFTQSSSFVNGIVTVYVTPGGP